MSQLEAANTASVRLDIWLWAARFFKTRGLAKDAICAGRVALQEQTVSKPARALRVGDRLRVQRGDELYEVSVLALSVNRGPAAAAQQLYSESAESNARRLQQREDKRLAAAGYQAPAHKPDKRARRKLERLHAGGEQRPPWFPPEFD